MYRRLHYNLIQKRLREKRKFIQVIFGPRQVGKTTCMQQVLEGLNIPYLSISADAVPAGNAVWLEQNWESARVEMRQKKAREFLLVIDEIQKISNWSEIVRLHWDRDHREKRNLKVVLLGSSRLLLQQGLTKSLAGRFETIYMGHWSLAEMHDAFGWTADQFVWFGGYPGTVDLIKDEQRWKDYLHSSLIEASISRDILMLTRVDKPALMKRLFELGCTYSGQILSFNKILGQLLDAGNTTTLSHYLQLLDTAGLLAGLEKYSKNTVRKKSSSPKFQVYNTALMSSQLPEDFNKIRDNPESWGRLVESAVGAHLLNHSISENYKLFYWRSGNDEVDFVIEKKSKTVGIEVKSGTTSGEKQGMVAFKNLMNPSKMLLIGKGGIPWKEFLKINPAEVF